LLFIVFAPDCVVWRGWFYIHVDGDLFWLGARVFFARPDVDFFDELG
jgi:hypothetical protein